MTKPYQPLLFGSPLPGVINHSQMVALWQPGFPTLSHYESLVITMNHSESLIITMNHYESLWITMNYYESLIHKMKSPNPISLSLRDLAPFAPSCGGPFLFGGPWLSGAWRGSLAQRNGLCYRRSKGSSNGFLILIDIFILFYIYQSIYLFTYLLNYSFIFIC